MERNEAIALNLPTYNTGRSCKWNHQPIRSTKTGQCIECIRTNTTRSQRLKSIRVAQTQPKIIDLHLIVHRDIALAIVDAARSMNALMGLPPQLNALNVAPGGGEAPVIIPRRPVVSPMQAELDRAQRHNEKHFPHMLTAGPPKPIPIISTLTDSGVVVMVPDPDSHF